jgi:probable phosphoglycerate mutase
VARVSSAPTTVAELIVVRHGQSAANAAFPVANAQGLLDAGVTGRDADVDLTDLGRVQAAALGRWLHDLPAGRRPQVVICSPYLRARQTWRYAAQASGLTCPAPSTDDRLVDRLTGDLELLTTAAIAARFPAEAARLTADGEYAYRPPGGESFGDVAMRLTSFLDDLNREHAGRRVIVLAHDAVVLMMRSVIEDLTWDEVAALAALGSVRNASISRFEARSGRLVRTQYNSVTHLPPA